MTIALPSLSEHRRKIEELELAWEILEKLTRPDGRRPPEAGLPVPAFSPNGPLPKEGGAAVAVRDHD